MHALLLLLLACSGGDVNDDTGALDDTGSEDTGEDTVDTDDPPAGTAALSGVVTDPDGAPVVGATVNVCKMICRTKITDDDGAFAFDGLEAWTHSFDVEPPHETGLATSLVPLTFQDDDVVELDVRVLPLGEPVDLPDAAAEVEVADDLHLTVEDGALAIPLVPDPVTEIAGVAVPEADLPHIELDGTVVAAWYLSPYKAEGDVPVRIENAWELPVGSTYELWYAVYESFAWVSGGTVTVGDDGFLTGDDANVGVFSTLVLLDPSSGEPG